jgi:hypothetical protein
MSTQMVKVIGSVDPALLEEAALFWALPPAPRAAVMTTAKRISMVFLILFLLKI